MGYSRGDELNIWRSPQSCDLHPSTGQPSHISVRDNLVLTLQQLSQVCIAERQQDYRDLTNQR
jgi:hypothetical protein